MFRLFVYGTLKQGFSAHDLLQGSVFLGAITTHPRYHLYRMGGFPGMVTGEEAGGVCGELFEVPDERLVTLDHYECVPSLFRRELIDLSDGSQAWAYLYNRRLGHQHKIKNGEWT